MYLDTPLRVQCDFDGCGQHLLLSFPAAHTADTHLCGVDGGVQVLWGSEVGHLQPLWDGGVFHHICSGVGGKTETCNCVLFDRELTVPLTFST